MSKRKLKKEKPLEVYSENRELRIVEDVDSNGSFYRIERHQHDLVDGWSYVAVSCFPKNNQGKNAAAVKFLELTKDPEKYFEIVGVRLNLIYGRSKDGQTFKTVGWVGAIKVALQYTKVYVRQQTPFGPLFSYKKVKGMSEKLLIVNLNDFIKEFGPVKMEHVKDV